MTEKCWSHFTRKNVGNARLGNAGAGSVYGPRPGVATKNTSGEANRDLKQVTVITESTKGELVAAMNRNAEGEALPKQSKNREYVSIPRLLNPTPMALRGTVGLNEPLRVPRVKPTRQKKKNVSKKAAFQEHVGKYNVVSELANAPSGLTFGQLVRGDSEGARKEMKRLLTRKSGRSRSFAGHMNIFPRSLRVVTVQVYGTDAQALQESGAVQNIMSPHLMKSLSLTPESTNKHITVAYGKSSPCVGSLPQVPVSFGGLVNVA